MNALPKEVSSQSFPNRKSSIIEILTTQIFKLVLRINNETERAAFLDLPGHVGWIKVQVSEGKHCGDHYNSEELYNVVMYVSPCIRVDVNKIEDEQQLSDIVVALNKMIKELKNFL